MVEVILADDTNAGSNSLKPAQLWQDFLQKQNVGHHAYSWHWHDLLGSVFGHRPLYLLAVSGESGSAVGILPMVLVRSMLFGKALISLPYLNAGGLIAESDDIASALLARAESIGRELQVDYLELRHAASAPFYEDRLPVRTHKVSMELSLTRDHEELFGAFPPKLRSQVRRPSKSGVQARVSGEECSDSESLSAFYSVFSEHMRDLGTPVYPKQLFSAVKRAFGKSCRIITVWHEGKPIAAGITVGQGSKTEIPWASALKKHNRLSPNMILYWTAIKTACQDGYSTFDFGRSSPESGTYRFKEQWGAKPVTLHWYYRMFRGELPDVNPNNPKFTALVSCWRRLPLPVANLLGPWLTRSIP